MSVLRSADPNGDGHEDAGDAPFVGRAIEIARLEDALACSGGTAFTITGDPGMGKTRLAREFARRATRRGVLALYGRALRFAPDEQLGVVADALNPHLADRWDEEADASGELRRSIDALAASDGGLMLTLDDFHCADLASFALVGRILRDPPRGRLLLVLAYPRAGAPWPLTAAMWTADAAWRLTELGLAPFGTGELAELVDVDLAAGERERLVRAAAGNPLYLLELARAGTAAEDAASGVGCPPAILQSVADELAQLSDEGRAFLKGAAVAGDPFGFVPARAASGLTDAAARAARAEATALGLMRAVERSRHAFRAPVVRGAVVELAGPAWCSDAHGRAARELIRWGAPPVEAAGHLEHWASPGDTESAELLAKAGREAVAHHPGRAARWLLRALELVPESADDDRRRELLAPAAVALMTAGRPAAAGVALGRALAASPAGVAGARAVIAAARGDRPAAIVATILAAERWHAGAWEQAAVLASEGLAEARSEGCSVVAVEAAALWALAEYGRGRMARARARVSEAEALAEQAPPGGLDERPWALAYLGYAFRGLERYGAAADWLERALAAAEATRGRVPLVAILAGLATVRGLQGRLDEAAEHAEAAGTASLGAPDEAPRLWALVARARVALRRQRPEVALELGERAVEVAARRGDGAAFARVAGCVRAEAMIGSGEVDAGRAALLEHAGGEKLTGVGVPSRVHWFCVLATADLAAGRPSGAERWIECAETVSRRLGLEGRVGLAARARAELLMARRRYDEAADVAAAAAARLRAAGQAVDAARADVLRARARAARSSAGVEELKRANAVLQALGLDPRRRFVSADGPARLDGRAGSLTPREQEVAGLVARGLTNREIAGELSVTVRTVEDHLSSILAKLGATSRSGVAAAIERARRPESAST
jgi:DNA-binding CsgD family transcriptional regulator/tetratricopeptide (TPR) repeat protein